MTEALWFASGFSLGVIAAAAAFWTWLQSVRGKLEKILEMCIVAQLTIGEQEQLDNFLRIKTQAEADARGAKSND